VGCVVSFIKGRLRRLERAAEGEMVVIFQQDGSIARFPQSALKEAFLRNMDFLHARANGEEPPEPHPLQVALQNAAYREPWHDTYFDMIEVTGPVEDLSEP
jgi:1,2-phenylacetyl-CoA epoxidase catalytic subunit